MMKRSTLFALIIASCALQTNPGATDLHLLDTIINWNWTATMPAEVRKEWPHTLAEGSAGEACHGTLMLTARNGEDSDAFVFNRTRATGCKELLSAATLIRSMRSERAARTFVRTFHDRLLARGSSLTDVVGGFVATLRVSDELALNIDVSLLSADWPYIVR